MAPSLSPEFLLAASCSMWPPSDRRNEAIRSAAAAGVDWIRFLRVAARHRVFGLVHDGLMRARPDLPSKIGREISAQAATLVRENLAMAGEAVRLQRLFDNEEIAVLFLKGASLAVLAYGNLGLRSSKDIDLLVSPERLPAAIALIARAGYRRFDPPPDTSDRQFRLLLSLRKDLGFVHQETGLQLELHWRLFLNPYAMEEASVLAASQAVPLTATSGLRTLGEEDLFSYLCVHGALHCWNQLKWLADIGALLTSDGSAERLNRAAEARGAGHAAAQAMLLCQRLLGMTRPIPLLTALRGRPKVRWLEKTALNVMTVGGGEQDPHDVRFGTTRGSLSTFLLGQSWRYHLAELATFDEKPTSDAAVAARTIAICLSDPAAATLDLASSQWTQREATLITDTPTTAAFWSLFHGLRRPATAPTLRPYHCGMVALLPVATAVLARCSFSSESCSPKDCDRSLAGF